MAHILLVDDEEAFSTGIKEFLGLHGHSVTCADSVATARRAIAKQVPEVVLLDLMLPDGSGLEILEAFQARRPQKIIIITGHGGVKSLISGIAGDGLMYLQKPIEPRELIGILNTLTPEAEDDQEAEPELSHFGLLIGESEAMQQVYEQIQQVAETDSTVFIQGESGTGKELVADAIHRLSNRSGAFVPVNCGGLSQELVSTQLFGHEKGSFTGANRRHLGFFERANGGTLFLDEITEMPLEMQTHLLRVLETGKVLRVGAEQETPVDARLVAATNRDPASAVGDGVLREDLYFRLRVFPIELPPLRERRGDVSLLAERFLDDLNTKHQTSKQFERGALQKLEAHSWPGNVRELKHTVQRAYIMAKDDAVAAPDSFDTELPGEMEGLRAGRSIAEVEKELILTTLEQLGGNKRAAADILGVSLKTLYNRLQQYQVD